MSICQEKYDEGYRCSCRVAYPCSFCTSMDEEEVAAYYGDGYRGLEKLWELREREQGAQVWRKALLDEAAEELKARREAEGVTEVPVWAVRKALEANRGRTEPAEWEAPLRAALGDREES